MIDLSEPLHVYGYHGTILEAAQGIIEQGFNRRILFNRSRRGNFMVNPKRAAKLIRQHFEEVTTEKFVENLQKYCPEVFSEQEQENKPKLSETKILSKKLN